MTDFNDERVRGAFAVSGYSYPGTPDGAVTLLVAEIARLQRAAAGERRQYATLWADVREAVDSAPHFGDGGTAEDPVRQVKNLAEHLAELRANDASYAAAEGAVRDLRAQFPEQSKAHTSADKFLSALAEHLAEQGDSQSRARVVTTSVAYWQAMQAGTPNMQATALAAARWDQAVRALLTDMDAGAGVFA